VGLGLGAWEEAVPAAGVEGAWDTAGISTSNSLPFTTTLYLLSPRGVTLALYSRSPSLTFTSTLLKILVHPGVGIGCLGRKR